MSNYKTYTDKEVEELYTLYKEGTSMKKLAKQIGRKSEESIRTLFKRRGYDTSIQRRYPIDETFFNKIDNELKAYYLGFIAADGCIQKSNSLDIAIQARDGYILEPLKDAIQPKKPLQIIYGKGNRQDQLKLSIRSVKLCSQLTSLGFPPNKSIAGMSYPNLSQDLHRHFIRGFFDGDGTITGCLSKTISRAGVGLINDGLSRKVKMVSTSKKFLEEINANLISMGLSKRSVIQDKSRQRKTPLYRLCYSSISDISKLETLFYTDANYYLHRKRKKFQLYLLTPSEYREVISSVPANA